ncbi:hypothetical protein SLEP1_g35081 [Rubroshorea leprosula]|uniref:Protein kinase domain-containing protein n=1 Tax=Rubroshorea leprosula TaxID=152421 RepID=A0AAV5KM53_9ROSI|nr:hypothetical protein SLEP1_g35081 [Rubroshorea leprosula]
MITSFLLLPPANFLPSSLKSSNPSRRYSQSSSSPLSTKPPGKFKPLNDRLHKHLNSGHLQKAISTLDLMVQQGTHPDLLTYSLLLKTCIRSQDLHHGKLVHNYLTMSELELDSVLFNMLISLYMKCGEWTTARMIFQSMGDKRDVVSWSAMISCFANNNMEFEAIATFIDMIKNGFSPNEYCFTAVIRACSKAENFSIGEVIFGLLIKDGYFDSDVNVGCALIDMLVKGSGDLESAYKVFDRMSVRNVITWTLMITRSTQLGYPNDAIDLFLDMILSGYMPDRFTLSSVTSACSELEFLVDMYVKCVADGSIDDSRRVFNRMPRHNVMSWTAIITGYVQSGGRNKQAIELFCKMIQGPVAPNHFTFASVLKACGNLSDSDIGKQVYTHAVKRRLASDDCVGNSLISMYARSGKVDDARKAFESLFEKSLVSYNAIVDAYTKNLDSEEAFQLFQEISDIGIGVNAFTFASLLSGASSIGAIGKGEQIHGQVIKSGFESNLYICNALISMYSRCGDIEAAFQVFNEMADQNVISWTAMITGFAKHGFATRALETFNRMLEAGIRPNEITYIAVLSACSHAGLISDGWEHFKSMYQEQGIVPRMEHYACMVDLLGRSGSLVEALEFMNSMPYTADALVWRTFLGACREKMITSFSLLPPTKFPPSSLKSSNLSRRNSQSSSSPLSTKPPGKFKPLNDRLHKHLNSGHLHKAISTLDLMVQQGTHPDLLTYSLLLKACIRSQDLHHGKLVHKYLTMSELELDSVLFNMLISLYMKCGEWTKARMIFQSMGDKRDVVSWSAMISCFANNNMEFEAISTFIDMIKNGFSPNEYCFTVVIRTCSKAENFSIGEVIFGLLIKSGYFDSDVNVGCALIDMLVKGSGDLESAYKVFDRMSVRNVITWTLMITRSTQLGYPNGAIDLFLDMVLSGYMPDRFTLSSVMSACSELELFSLGQQLHSLVIRSGLASDVCVGCSLVDMYVKCVADGSIDDSRRNGDVNGIISGSDDRLMKSLQLKNKEDNLSLQRSLALSSSTVKSEENVVVSGFGERTCEKTDDSRNFTCMFHGFLSVMGRRREMEEAVKGQQPEHCGYHGFELSCEEKQIVLKLPRNVKLFVKRIDYKAQRIQLYDPQGCLPLQLPNLNLSASPFQYLRLTPFRFNSAESKYNLFNCSREATVGINYEFYEIPCLSVPGFQVLAFPSDSTSAFNLISCRRTLLNISETAVYEDMLYYQTGDVHLSWSQPDCSKCEEGGSKCKLKNNNRIQDDTECYGTTKNQRVVEIFPYFSCSIALVLLLCYAENAIGCGHNPRSSTISKQLEKNSLMKLDQCAESIMSMSLARLGFVQMEIKELLLTSTCQMNQIFATRDQSCSLSWENLQDIAIGIAKGIEYLHQGCDKQILHFDIKPHNILLDHHFNPKISDFGLAKLCSKEQRAVSMTAARGTMGYIAPEVLSRNFGKVSYKSDVYSFGMLLLEMVGGRKNIDITVGSTSQVYFPEWVYNCLERGEVLGIRIENEGHAKITRKLTIVGLWRIQWYPTDRPSMKSVVHMLEGEADSLTMPPNPFGHVDGAQTSANIPRRPINR